MNLFFKNTSSFNRNLIYNSIGGVLVKGGGMIIAIISVPLYMNYFPDNSSLGVWYTILNVLNWILTFDLGIGNGLRNHLTTAIALQDYTHAKKLISSSYVVLGLLVIVISIVFFLLSSLVNWNSFFNISSDNISSDSLRYSVNITMIGILCTFFTRIIGSVLYAIQKAAVNNSLSLSTNILMVIYLFLFNSTNDANYNMRYLAVYNAIATNLPFVIASFFVFRKKTLRDCLPSLSYFNFDSAKKVVGLGSKFLFLQLLFMAICGTNEWFISKFFAPQYCVDYQVYFRVFTIIGSFFMIAITPLWSAMTKAKAERNYEWLNKTQKILYFGAIATVFIQLLIVPILQPLLDVWLKEKTIIVDTSTVMVFVFYSSTIILNNVESTIVCGLGCLKIQLYGYIVAIVIKVLFIVFLSHITNDWTIVVLFTSVGLLPYLVIQPFFIKKEISILKTNN